MHSNEDFATIEDVFSKARDSEAAFSALEECEALIREGQTGAAKEVMKGLRLKGRVSSLFFLYELMP